MPSQVSTTQVTTTPSDSPIVLEARGLHRFFKRQSDEIAALKDVSFEARAGEFLAVMGPSGSGKSTLVNLLAGLDDPDGGSVWVEGLRLSHRSAADNAVLRGCHIGVLTQSSGLIEHLSVLGNVELAHALRRRARHSRRARSLRVAAKPALGDFGARALLDGVGLSGRHGLRPSRLSGGETARANLAVALAGAPAVVLADEPTAEVSRQEEVDVLRLLGDIRPPTGVTVVVTHSEAVAGVADRVIELVDGRQK
jgi:putative ABC transport system ATP-binding protein